ncbi:bifunctional 3-(3-hydroxy-phenyl)propionate/3-hydroxycinnamic acid hydroxylase [Lacisediminihabitans sp. H27-G8]|uniref:bifunctional 3-(3-hydroxy-phenyl)propionate/3-hydroxycinnamic acid hydroxylase MhpA n=1 Tax=Lacisediminihabitans sp. H27-G8 TaxID=3111909 RepID=UPI0038FC9D73
MNDDFLIVGAGPVGLLTAILLGREGRRVTVVERWPARYPMPRACTIDHEALRILQAAGVMDQHSDLFEPSRGERGGYQIRNGDGALLRAINWNRPGESGWANTNGFYQPDLEEALERMAQAIPTVTIRRGIAGVSVEQDDSSVTLTMAEGERLRASWLIASDGANSVIRESLGIESVDSGFEADWLVVDYKPIVDRDWDAFVTQYCDPEQPATAVRSGPGRRRFEFMRRADVTAEELGRADTAWRLMQPWGITPANTELERHAVYTFRGRWTTQWRKGRVFLAGDAAHLMPPFLGQGLCAGLRDARALTWRLSMVADELANESILDTYGSERGMHVREIIDEAVELGKVICELDPDRAGERDARMRAELESERATVEPPHPRLGTPSITSDDDRAGTLSIQARVAVGDFVGLFDDLVGGTWQLIGNCDPLASTPADLRDWFLSIGGTSTDIASIDVDGDYRRWFESNECSAVLARPDFYIYGTGEPADVPRLLADLRAALTNSHTREGALL